MEFMPHGDLIKLLTNVGKMKQDMAKFYTAQLVLVFEFIHNLDLIYRDLKPENVLLT